MAGTDSAPVSDGVSDPALCTVSTRPTLKVGLTSGAPAAPHRPAGLPGVYVGTTADRRHKHGLVRVWLGRERILPRVAASLAGPGLPRGTEDGPRGARGGGAYARLHPDVHGGPDDR